MALEQTSGISYAFQRLKGVGMSDSYARQVEAKALITSHHGGDVLWRQGEAIGHWCYIINGSVLSSINSKSGNATPIGFHGERSWFGERLVFAGAVSDVDFICLEPTDLLCIPSGVVVSAFEHDHQFAIALNKRVLWHSQQVADFLRITHCGNGNLRTVMGIYHYAAVLHHDRGRHGQGGSDEFISLVLSQTQFSALCGVSRTVFSDVVKHLVSAGLIRIGYGRTDVFRFDLWTRYIHELLAWSGKKSEPDMAEILRDFAALDGGSKAGIHYPLNTENVLP